MTITIGKWGQPVALVLLAAALSCCTAVPAKHFTAYKETFDKARAAGEQVLLDYGVARTEKTAIKAAIEPEEENLLDQVNARREAQFDVDAARNDEVSIDHIVVRMQAWDVVARYNEALTGLAEGKSVTEVAGLVDGLYQNLSTFPFEGIAEVASKAAPFIGALKTLLTKAQEESSRQEFIRVVKEGGPVIRSLFITNLRADAQNFYKIRYALNDIAYREKLDEIADLTHQFNELANRYKVDAAAADLTKVTDETNDILRRVPGLLTGDEAQDSEILVTQLGKGTTSYNGLANSQLVQLKDQIAAAAAQAGETNEQLEAYKKLLVAYVKLLDEVAGSLRALEKAADAAAMPSFDELLSSYVELRQAYDTFKSKSKG